MQRWNQLGRLLRSDFVRVLITSSILIFYLAYVFFVIRADQGPVDFETFMSIGRRFVEGEKIYGENSYYPLPYVAIFGLLSALPRPLAMGIWLLAPVLIVLAIARYRPYALLFAPVVSHFTGGQSSVFGLLGFYGYRIHLDPGRYSGGFFLALTCLKPQLAIVPVGYAVYRWLEFFIKTRKFPAQAAAFLLSMGIAYVPAFLLRPGWVAEWLSAPRPLFDRAISAAVPRLLLWSFSPEAAAYWIFWLVLSALVVIVVWRLKGSSHPLDILMLIGFIVNPLMHDYDLIQVLPVIWGPIMPAASVLLSIPGWWTILFQYANDAAWVTFSLIAPGLLIVYILQCSGKNVVDEPEGVSRCLELVSAGDPRLERMQ